MIQQINNKVGRNDDCPCGSGKKYKKCCMPKSPPKNLTPQGLHKCFLLLVKAADGLVVSCTDIDAVPKEAGMEVIYDADTDTFHLKYVELEKKLILTPDSRIKLR